MIKNQSSRGGYFIYWILTSCSHCRSNCINVPKLINVRKENKDRSFRFAQTASISLNSVELSEFTSLSFLKIVVLTVVLTASTYLSSLTFAKVRRKSHRFWWLLQGDYYEKVQDFLSNKVRRSSFDGFIIRLIS